MGVSRSPQHLAAKLRAFANDMPDASRQGVRVAGFTVKHAVDLQLSADVPSRSLRSGARSGRSTARALSTRLGDMRRIPENPAVLLSARGPWQVFERPTAPHQIMSKAYRRDVGRALRSLQQGGRTRRSRSQRSRVLAFGGQFAAHVQHPGTKQGKRTWERGVQRGAPHAPRAFEREIVKAMGKVFR